MVKKFFGVSRMNKLETLHNIKLCASNARYCNLTPDYKEMTLEAELERIEHLADLLIRENELEN
jgi:hypothetical protein